MKKNITMKLNKIIVVMLMSIAAQMSFGATKSVFKIEKIEPEFWYTGMKETQLQLSQAGQKVHQKYQAQQISLFRQEVCDIVFFLLFFRRILGSGVQMHLL